MQTDTNLPGIYSCSEIGTQNTCYNKVVGLLIRPMNM